MFTKEQIEQLERNPNTEYVSAQLLRFTPQFKEELWQAYKTGVNPKEFFQSHGYDLEIIGNKRIENTIRLICQKKLNSTESKLKEDNRELSARINVLESELEALKKIIILANSGRSKH